MRTTTYRLSVFEPGSRYDELFQAESNTPFGAINEGDLFHLDSVAGFAATGIFARVGRVVHVFSGATEAALVHHIEVFLVHDNWRDTAKIFRTESDSVATPATLEAQPMSSSDEFGS